MKTFITLCVMFFSVSPAFAKPKAGSVISVNGSVRISGKQAQAGQKVFSGQKIVTGKKGEARLLMIDDTLLDLKPKTILVVNKYNVNKNDERNADLTLRIGRVRADIQRKLKKKGKFRLKTKTSVLSVRGTTFAVDVGQRGSEITSRVVVANGELEVTPLGGEPVRVPSGTQLTSSGRLEQDRVVPTQSTRGVREATKIAASEVEEFVDKSTVEDKSFQKEVQMDESDPSEGGFNESEDGGREKEDGAPRRGPASEGASDSQEQDSGGGEFEQGDGSAEGGFRARGKGRNPSQKTKGGMGALEDLGAAMASGGPNFGGDGDGGGNQGPAGGFGGGFLEEDFSPSVGGSFSDNLFEPGENTFPLELVKVTVSFVP